MGCLEPSGSLVRERHAGTKQRNQRREHRSVDPPGATFGTQFACQLDDKDQSFDKVDLRVADSPRGCVNLIRLPGIRVSICRERMHVSRGEFERIESGLVYSVCFIREKNRSRWICRSIIESVICTYTVPISDK